MYVCNVIYVCMSSLGARLEFSEFVIIDFLTFYLDLCKGEQLMTKKMVCGIREVGRMACDKLI